jgi:hypothetical protein
MNELTDGDLRQLAHDVALLAAYVLARTNNPQLKQTFAEICARWQWAQDREAS